MFPLSYILFFVRGGEKLFYWKNILYGFIAAVVITLITFLAFVIVFPDLYGVNRYFYWGNSIVLFTFFGVIGAAFVNWSTTRRIQKVTKNRYQKITWEHPDKIKYYNTNRAMYWIGIWGALIYSLLYALDIIRLDLDQFGTVIRILLILLNY